MFKTFFEKVSTLQVHHQFFVVLIVFVGVSAIWWSGYVLFDEFFIPKVKQHYRLLWAFLLGLLILIAAHRGVTVLL